MGNDLSYDWLPHLQFDAEQFLRSLTTEPGVYRMLNSEQQVLYVGKAKNLKNRVSSYFRKAACTKTQVMMSQVAFVELTVTRSATEALLLEANLIKSLRPKYNILLKDDKSYPYLSLSVADDYPRLEVHRGTKKAGKQYFGPYASAGSARQSLNVLQKCFMVRQCQDSYFKNRTRPCLQYQINRCSAPCVGYISKEDYQQEVNKAVLFLQGKCPQLLLELTHTMHVASEQQDYEKAAQVRDQIKKLRALQEQQYVIAEQENCHVLGFCQQEELVSISIVIIRQGSCLGSKSFTLKRKLDNSDADVLASFLSQYYLSKKNRDDLPEKIIVDTAVAEKNLLQAALQTVAADIKILVKPMGKLFAQWRAMAALNAKTSLQAHLGAQSLYSERLQQLQQVLPGSLDIKRLECFDISHTMGEHTVASCVVFDENGPCKSAYRCYNVKEVAAGDDYAAMRFALEKRYSAWQQREQLLPDCVVIDGGKGQLRQAQQVLQSLHLSDIFIISLAKGPARKSGQETLYYGAEYKELLLDENFPARHLLQHIRDEAHRFAITGHKQRRGKSRKTSTLEQIPGVGAKRRKDLLSFFGGLRELKEASVEEISKIPGISKQLATVIQANLRD